MASHALVPVSDGCEEIETTTIINTLRRTGTQVTVASCNANGALAVTGSRNIQLKADCFIESCTQKYYQLIALPGGMPGAQNLRDCRFLTHMLKEQKNNGRWYAAICASPAIVLSTHGLLDNVRATCHPSLMDKMEGAMVQPGQLVVVDQQHRVITAQGAGNALSFAFQLIDALYGKDTYRPIAKQIVADWVL
ncbi:DJ-1 family glyoxalase III [Candidatus Sororendozoicomonas aggregata]|uniref:DJ-1 family glyoxalase III n=1 Tax=Candidatus Sororendozoicomonas aggregata TaxID=3073239 RepID=UPI002ED59EC6